METVVHGIEKNADYYRGYLTDDRSFGPIAFVLVVSALVGLAFYLTGGLGQAPKYNSLAAAQAIHATDGSRSGHGAYVARR